MEHTGIPVIRDMRTAGKYGMSTQKKAQSHKCETCVESKNTKAACNGAVVDELKEITVYINICGPMKNTTIQGNRYFVPMATAPHRYIRTKLLLTRREVHDHCLDFIAWLDRIAPNEVRRLHTDSAPDFLALRKALNRKRITLITLTQYTPPSNCWAERANGALITRVQSMTKQAKKSKQFWGETLMHDL